MFEGVGRRREQTEGGWLDIGAHSLNGREHKCLFRNNGDGTFTDVAHVDAADRIEDGRGLSLFDYDGDGQVDILMRNYRQPAQLLHNTGGPEHWIEFKLIGTRSNRDAVGARVIITAGGHRQLRQVSCGSAYLSSQSLVQHFGLGATREVEQVEVQWPSGASSVLEHVPADRILRITEDGEGETALTGY
jgi:enediyne biosynthesis protein E4